MLTMPPELMEKLVAEFDNKKMHPIENAALSHLNFEGIHTFMDGNATPMVEMIAEYVEEQLKKHLTYLLEK